MREKVIFNEFDSEIITLEELPLTPIDPEMREVASSAVEERHFRYLQYENVRADDAYYEKLRYRQVFIANNAFLNSLEELQFYIREVGNYNIEDLMLSTESEWTVPQWTKPGDIVFFMYAKTAISATTALRTALQNNKDNYREDYDVMMSWINRALHLYKLYGGKIFAVGRIASYPKPEPGSSDPYHWKSRVYAKIDKIHVFKEPLHISEFNGFITISRQSSITPVYGEDYRKLKVLLEEKNDLPLYVKQTEAVPLSLSKINKENWLEVNNRYARSYRLESQFRSFYVDFFLKELADHGPVYEECRCIKPSHPDTFVDNVILFNGKYLPVEVKLSVPAQKSITTQAAQYSYDSYIYINKRGKRIVPCQVYENRVLIIDTMHVYYYDADLDSIWKIYDLNQVKSIGDIKALKTMILNEVTG